MPSWTHPTAAERFLHRHMGPLVRGFWSGLQWLLRTKALRHARGAGAVGKARLRVVIPTHALVPDLRSATALAPDAYYSGVAHARITPHRAQLAGFDRHGVRLSDGSVLHG